MIITKYIAYYYAHGAIAKKEFDNYGDAVKWGRRMLAVTPFGDSHVTITEAQYVVHHQKGYGDVWEKINEFEFDKLARNE